MGSINYTEKNSAYLKKNPTWHVEGSPWKTSKIIELMNRNNLHPKTVAEIGCGAGEILNQLHQRLEDKTILFSGYEISPDAYELSKQRTKDRLVFFQEDLLASSKTFDLLLLIDVFEHVEDYIGFIRKASNKGTYKIYHIPLDISFFYLFKNQLMVERNAVGHLHYFTKDTALATLTDTGQKIIDWFYTKHSLELYNKNLTFKGKVMNFLRRLTYKYNPDLAVKLYGGFSLIVLTE